MSDQRRDWRLFMKCATRADLLDELGPTVWIPVTDGTLAHCRRERDARQSSTYWTDWSIRRPEDGRPA